MKVLMLILASDGGENPLYSTLETLKRTYVHSNPYIDAYFYKADPTLDADWKIVGDTIYVKTEETYPYLWKKFWLVLQAVEHRLCDYDFVCRPNLSTFMILDRYMKHVETLPKERCCSGVVFYGGQTIPFPAGYCFTLSSDVARQIIYSDAIENNHGIDDRCVGVVVQKLGIDIINHPLVEINNYVQEEKSLLKEIDHESCFMVRIRHFISSDDKPFGTDTETRLADDLTVHRRLLEIFYPTL